MNSSLFPVVHLNDRTGQVFTYSYDVADSFGRRHDHIIRDIRDLKEKNQNLAPQYWGAKYTDRGKKYPCYKITEEGLGSLIIKFRGQKKNAAKIDAIKMAYAEQFTSMRGALKFIPTLKQEEISVCKALEDHRKKLGKETQEYHYMNENKMMDRVLLGCSLDEFRSQQGHSEGKPIKDLLTAEELARLSQIRMENHRMIEQGIEYDDRKTRLMQLFSPDRLCIEGVTVEPD